MAFAATRCFDSLASCSSLRGSSWGIADSAPTCMRCIFTCYCFATARSLELKQLEQAPRQAGAALDLHPAPGQALEGLTAAAVGELRDPAGERRGRQLHHVGQRAADHHVGAPVAIAGVVLDEDLVGPERKPDRREVLGEADLDPPAERARGARMGVRAVLDQAEQAR